MALTAKQKAIWESWILDLRRSIDYGENTYANMSYDLNTRRISRRLFHFFQTHMVTRWSHKRPRVKAHHIFERLLVDRRIRNWQFFCQGPPVTLIRDCSRVIDFDVLREYSFIESSLASPGFSSLDYGTADENDVILLVNCGLAGLLKSNAEIRGSKPFAWVTPTEILSHFKRVPNNPKPEYIRDILGLFYDYSVFMIEIKYPLGHEVTFRLKAPTFLDGCPNYVYRSRKQKDSWGRAVDLSSSKYNDGLPEAVHEPIPFTSDFEIEYIGRTKGSSPIVRWSKLNRTI